MKRIWELDFMRGVAIILMVVYHLVFDLHVFAKISYISPFSSFWFIEGKIAAGLFIFLVGVLTAVLYFDSVEKIFKKNLKRGLRLLALGIIINIASYIFDPSQMIYFGILHFLGIGLILSSFFIKLKTYWLFLSSILTLLVGIFFQNIFLSHNFLIVLGLKSREFMSFDYFPIFPWLAVMLLGLMFGKHFYKSPQSIIKKPNILIDDFLIFCGRHSLVIYFIHQPVILGVVYLLVGK